MEKIEEKAATKEDAIIAQSTSSFGINLDDLAKEVSSEEDVKEEKIAITEDHSCYIKEEAPSPDKTSSLSVENLDVVWKKLLAWFQANEQQNLYDLLDEKTPDIKGNSLVLTLDSSVEKNFIENNSAQIKGFLKHNITDFETLILKVTTSTESKKYILNAKDKYQKLVEKNALLEKLKQSLNLELEL